MTNGLKNKKILIAEDSEINYILLKKNLEIWGAFVIWVKNGQELVDTVERMNDIDLILLDINMPRLDGFAAVKIIRDAGIRTPIIAQSAFVMDSDIDRIIAAGCNDYLDKPVNKEELLNKINALLQ